MRIANSFFLMLIFMAQGMSAWTAEPVLFRVVRDSGWGFTPPELSVRTTCEFHQSSYQVTRAFSRQALTITEDKPYVAVGNIEELIQKAGKGEILSEPGAMDQPTNLYEAFDRKTNVGSEIKVTIYSDKFGTKTTNQAPAAIMLRQVMDRYCP